jgi:hypothetical protein
LRAWDRLDLARLFPLMAVRRLMMAVIACEIA